MRVPCGHRDSENMKTNRLLPLVLVLGGLCVQEVRAFYNPSTGRWLSRDPIEESGFAVVTKNEQAEKDGGPNHYEFVANSPVNDVDYLGQFRVDPKTRTVLMAKCDIVVLYGHGGVRRPYKWKYVSNRCSAGAAVMCWPDDNMGGLEDSMRLWTQWDGVSLSEANWEKVSWGLAVNGPLWHTIYGVRFPNANRVLITHVLVNAVRKAFEICDRGDCGCQKVVIGFVQIDDRGRIVDPSRPIHGVPQMPKSITVTCPKGPISCP